MISEKLQMLAAMVRSLAAQDEPIDGPMVAAAIERMLPHIAAMEDEPIPERKRRDAFKLIIGGKTR